MLVGPLRVENDPARGRHNVLPSQRSLCDNVTHDPKGTPMNEIAIRTKVALDLAQARLTELTKNDEDGWEMPANMVLAGLLLLVVIAVGAAMTAKGQDIISKLNG